MTDVLLVIMRWLHIASMATLVGGMIFGRMVTVPAIETMDKDSGEALADQVAGRFRPLVFAAMGGLLISGLFNFLTTTGHRPIYHMLFGIKMLLVLHVFAVSILITQPKNPRRGRMMTGVIISGLIILVISAYLRRIF